MLGNQAINSNMSFSGIPTRLFPANSDGLLRWLPQASEDELLALFRNPMINQSFLRDFLECKGPCEALGNDARRSAISRLLKYLPNMSAPLTPKTL